ncbi:hypothetical protein SAMN05216302_101477 [Nitrosomonas aestuarii]|uniref:Uncharacterized protein n=1 Tax=Nitrosomonas aestuarii TaxID=52441 RepID=A0A1I4C5H8_9PROT|nr:hypothetical protein [Nitrosomonas aestuarii]SFK75559.1 hypothetical protein SAMN05216302_101477 [Nitrosomonas aestuarii]
MIIGNIDVDKEIAEAKQRIHDQIDGVIRFKKKAATINIKFNHPIYGLLHPTMVIDHSFYDDGYMYFRFSTLVKVK